jgi:hypothetical protein
MKVTPLTYLTSADIPLPAFLLPFLCKRIVAWFLCQRRRGRDEDTMEKQVLPREGGSLSSRGLASHGPRQLDTFALQVDTLALSHDVITRARKRHCVRL